MNTDLLTSMKNFWWNKINYKPDFTLSHNGKKIVIEYFGLAGHPDYDKEIENEHTGQNPRNTNF